MVRLEPVLRPGRVDDLVDVEVRRLRATTSAHITASIEAARVVGDHGRLQQVVRNLCDNAVRHCVAQVALTLTTEDGCARLAVDNDGPAIPPEARAVVFDRFVRLPEAQEGPGPDDLRPGNGLGLAIARTLVEAHDGRIAVVEHPRGWCRFEVRLPLAPVLPA